MTDDLYDLVGLDADDHEAREAVADAESVADLITALVSIRRDSGLTQQVVAERMGTTQSAVSELERIATDPHVSTLQRFGRAVGARLAWKLILDGGWTQVDSDIDLRATTDFWDDDTLDSSSVTDWKPIGFTNKAALRIVC